MIIAKNVFEFLQLRKELAKDRLVGFVPTMGALHAGHLSLFQKAKKNSEFVVASIFVNPTQFNNTEDLDNYPNTLKEDLKLCEESGVDLVFTPHYDELYSDNYRYRVIENEFASILCGATRPGHFDGVLSIVLKLFNIVSPDRAFFGEKDYQQLQLIKGMVETFFLDIKIIGCPIIRENNGLALSSRNKLLTKSESELAPEFNRIISSKSSLPEMRAELENFGFKIDYLEEHFDRRFGAVFLGEVRLIDNVKA